MCCCCQVQVDVSPLCLAAHAVFALAYHIGYLKYTLLYFESDADTAKEITLKVSSVWMCFLRLEVTPFFFFLPFFFLNES